jgi:hypothetical protein
MRSGYAVAALSLFALAGACSKREEPIAGLPDDLKKDLASASVPGLATAPQRYQRMRFVSDIEQSRATQRAPRPKPAHDHHMAPSESPSAETNADVAAEAVSAMATAAPSVVATTEAPIPEPTVVIAARPVPEPPHGHGPSSTEGDILDHAGSGGIGSIIGGIIGTAVIRGGRAGVDKCDPRTDGRMRPQGRPDFSMPSPIGRPIFGSPGRR